MSSFAMRAGTCASASPAQIRLAVIACIGNYYRIRRAQGGGRRDHWQQQLLLGTDTVRLRDDDDQVCRIDGDNAGVALGDASAGRHLRALIVRAVALAHRAGRATMIRRVLPKPREHLHDVA